MQAPKLAAETLQDKAATNKNKELFSKVLNSSDSPPRGYSNAFHREPRHYLLEITRANLCKECHSAKSRTSSSEKN